MMIILGRRLNGKPWLHTMSGNGSSGSNPTPPSITGITFSQPQPIPAGMVGSGPAQKFICATFNAVGGTGPFKYEVDTVDSGGFTALGTDSNIFDGTTDRGWVVIPYNTGAATAKTLKITDATGAAVTQPVTFNTSGGAGIYIPANRTWATNVNPYTLNLSVALWNGSSVDTATNVTVTDPSGYFTFAYGGVTLVSASNFPPAGNYPLTVAAAGYTTQSVTIVIVAAHAGTPYFLQTLAPVSTSVLAGTVVGKIICATPNNTFSVTLNDTTGTLGINGSNVVIANQPSMAGPLNFSFTVTDLGGNTTAFCSSSNNATLTIAAGTTLPSTNMNFGGLTTTLNNDTWVNTIGTPSVTGVTGTKQWTLASQTGFNPLAVNSAFGTSPARYQIDPAAGTITAPAPLSAGLDGSSSATDILVVSCTDGINTCTAPLNITVHWAPISQTFYVGQGMSAAHGANGFEHLVDLRVQIATSDNAPHSGTFHVLIYANASPDYYANDTGIITSNYPARFPWPGPIIVEGVAANGVSQPRMGGPYANNVGGGGDMRGKGFWVFGNGDAVIKNVEVSGCHDAAADGSHGVEAIRKDGETYGNLSIQHCYLHDNDNNMLSGVCHGTFLAEYNQIENGGTSYVSSGATHNAYIGEMGQAIFRYNVSRRSTNGYDLKCRAMVTQVYNNRFLDGLSGSASALIDLPFAGQASIYNNYMEKGPMALGPDTIRYGEEGVVWAVNTLNVYNNTIAVLTLPGGHYGGPSLIGWFGGSNSGGVAATGALTNNSIYMVPGGAKILAYNGASAASVVETGTTTLALPASIDSTRPDLSGAAPSARPLYRHQSYGQDSFVNFDGAYHYQDRDQIQIPHTTPTGTTICNLRATNQVADQGAGTANPFAAGTTWSLVADATPYGSFASWAAPGKYTLVGNSDGSAALNVGSATLTAGVDYLQVRATAPNGKITDSRYAVVVS